MVYILVGYSKPLRYGVRCRYVYVSDLFNLYFKILGHGQYPLNARVINAIVDW